MTRNPSLRSCTATIGKAAAAADLPQMYDWLKGKRDLYELLESAVTHAASNSRSHYSSPVDIARNAAVVVAYRILNEDQALKGLQAEVETLRARLIEYANLTPMTVYVPKEKDVG